MSSRKPAACEAVRDEIVRAGGEAIVVPCNVGDKGELQRMQLAAYQWANQLAAAA